MPEPEMHTVTSSNVDAVGYDAENSDLYVRFLSGQTYVYSQVAQTTFEELLYAESVGSYLNRMVKPNYPVQKL